MWQYNYNELYHHGVKGMKWGVRKANRRAKRDSEKFAGMLRDVKRAASDYVESTRTQTIRTISDDPNSPVGTFAIYDKNKKKKFYDAINKANSYMNQLDKKYGKDWSHSDGIEKGKRFVEANIRGSITRYYVD